MCTHVLPIRLRPGDVTYKQHFKFKGKENRKISNVSFDNSHILLTDVYALAKIRQVK